MNKMLKNCILFTLIFTCYAGSVYAFPHTIIVENKTNKPQTVFITSKYTLKNVPYKRSRTLEEIVPAHKNFVFGSNNHSFTTLIIKVSDGIEIDGKLHGSLVTGLGTMGSVAKIKLLENNQFAVDNATYFEQTQLRILATRKAIAQQFAKTGMWFSDLWRSIMAAFTGIFAHTNSETATSEESLQFSQGESDHDLQQYMPKTPERISWSEIMTGKLGSDYSEKMVTIINTDYTKSKIPNMNDDLQKSFFKQDATGQAIEVQIPAEQAKEKIDRVAQNSESIS